MVTLKPDLREGAKTKGEHLKGSVEHLYVVLLAD